MKEKYIGILLGQEIRLEVASLSEAQTIADHYNIKDIVVLTPTKDIITAIYTYTSPRHAWDSCTKIQGGGYCYEVANSKRVKDYKRYCCPYCGVNDYSDTGQYDYNLSEGWFRGTYHCDNCDKDYDVVYSMTWKETVKCDD